MVKVDAWGSAADAEQLIIEAQERLANEHSGITGPEGDGAQERLKSEGH